MMAETQKKVLITTSPLPSELEEGERVEDSELEPPKPSISHHKKKKKKNSKNPPPILDLSEFTIKKVADSNDARPSRPSSSKRLAENDGKRTPSKKAKVKDVVEEEDIEAMYPHLCLSFDDKVASAVLKFLWETLSLMDRSKAEELDEEWTKLDVMEAKILIKKAHLMSKQMKLLCP